MGPATTSVVVVGAGRVGSALAHGLVGAGHEVRVAGRDPDGERMAALSDRRMAVVPLAGAAAGVDAAILAVPVAALAEVVPVLGAGPGTVLVDATNAVGTPVPEGAATVHDHVVALAGDAPVVKAFNTIGAEHLDGRSASGLSGTRGVFLPVAGADAGRPLVVGLARSLGFDAVDLGGPEAVGHLEAHARLWIHLALRVGWGREFGFSVVGPREEV